jgi:hypothetical protein
MIRGSDTSQKGTEAEMKKPNLILVGRVKIEVSEDGMEELDNVIIVQCEHAMQVREALQTGKLDFLIFGQDVNEPKQERLL